MSEKDGRFDSAHQPTRRPGQAQFKTKVFDAMRKGQLLEDQRDEHLTEEQIFIAHLTERALNPDDGVNVEAALDRLVQRMYPAVKSTLPAIEIDWDRHAPRFEQANSIMTAIANGQIPADIGNTLIQSIKTSVDIETADFKERLEKLEAIADEQRTR